MRRLSISLLFAVSLRAASLLANGGGTTLLSGDWTQITSALGVVPTNGVAGGYDKSFYVPKLDLFIELAVGYRTISAEPNRSYVGYSLDQNTWFVLDTNTNVHDDQLTDAGHPMGGSISPDPTTGIFYGFCCESGAQAVEAARHTWVWDSLSQTGRDVHTGAGTPLSPTGAKPYINILLPACAFDGIVGKLVCFGGATSQDVSTIEYTAATNAWAFNTASGPSLQLASASMRQNSVDGKLYMVMGSLGGVGTSTCNTSGTSVTRTDPNHLPFSSGLVGNAVVINGVLYIVASFTDSDHITLTTSAGTQTGVAYDFGQNAVWTYSTPTQTWTKVITNCTISSTCPAPRLSPAFAYDPDDNVFVMFGGILASNGATPVNDGYWVLDPVALTWTNITPAHSPTNSFGGTFERFDYSLKHKAFVLFASAGGANTMEVWALCLKSCPNAGVNQPATYSNVYNQTAGLNRVITANAPTTALSGTAAAGGSTLYQAWDELGGTADATVCKTFHPFAQQTASGTVTQLPNPSGCLSIAGGSYANGGIGSSAGTANGTTTFQIGGAFNFTSGCGGTCAGKHIMIQGVTMQTIASVTDATHVVVSAAIPSATGLAWAVIDAPTGTAQTFETAGANVTVVAGVPWVAFRMSSGNGSTWGNDGLDYVLALGYSGGSWSLGGIVGKGGSTGSAWNQGPAQIIDVNGKPTLILKQIERDATPWHSRAYVFQFDGTFWNPLGGALNLTGDVSHITYADSVSLVSDGTNPIAIWTEYTTATAGSPVRMLDSAPQVRAVKWNGSTWAEPCSGSGNQDTTQSAYSVSATYMSATFYVAFQQRTATGNANIRVRSCPAAGGSWASVGGAIVLASQTGWTFAPSITNDGTTLYIAWAEQGKSATWNSTSQGSFSERSQVHVAQWTGSTWAAMGGSLNTDTAYGAANHPSIATVGTGTPVVQWGETKLGSLRQIYAKQYNPTTLDFGSLSAPACSITTLSLPGATVGTPYSQTLAQSNCTSSTWGGFTATGACSGLALNSSTGVLSGTPTTAGTCSFTAAYDTATQPLSITVSAAPSTPASQLVIGTVVRH